MHAEKRKAKGHEKASPFVGWLIGEPYGTI